MSNKNLWNLIEEEHQNKFLIDDFRKIDGFNERLGSWGPIIKNSRYFKSLLFEFSNTLNDRCHKELGQGLVKTLSKIKKRNTGKPVYITYEDAQVDIDYLLSVEEILFLNEELLKSKSILEIGPGFGRLCHSVLQTFSNIEHYYLIDLDFMSLLQEEYLKTVLTEGEFNKVKFITPEDIYKIKNIDISINIDSFQEIEPNVVLGYLDFISSNSKYFYSKNAICKYSPNNVDIDEYNDEQYSAALKMGLCRDVIDIYNTNELEMQKTKYVNSYCPKNMNIIKTQNCFGQFNFYYSALYSV